MQDTIFQGKIMTLTTRRTHLCRGGEAVDLDDPSGALLCYPFHDLHKAGETEVADLAPPARFHAREVQVLEVQCAVFITQGMSQLVVMFPTLIRHPRLMPRQRAM